MNRVEENQVAGNHQEQKNLGRLIVHTCSETQTALKTALKVTAGDAAQLVAGLALTRFKTQYWWKNKVTLGTGRGNPSQRTSVGICDPSTTEAEGGATEFKPKPDSETLSQKAKTTNWRSRSHYYSSQYYINSTAKNKSHLQFT